MKNDYIKIAYLADGSSVHTKRWLDYFSSRDYEVHLITYKRTRIENVKVHRVATAKTKIPFRVIQTIRLVRKIKPDILHAFYITNNGAIGALSGFHPLVLSAWGSDISVDPEKHRILRFLVTFALKRADLVHTGDEVGRKRLMELGCDAETVFVQHGGVDTQRFSPKARSQSLRRSLGIDDVYSVICARWWRPQYRVDVFIRAMPLVLKAIPDVRFILLGGGSLENKFKELARRLGVYESVLFIGRIPEEEMPKYLASVDVYVDTVSDYRVDATGDILVARGGGGMGQTTRQVMACGTPQILSDQLSVRLSDWFRGLRYKQLDNRDLAEKIVELLKHERLRRKIGEESRKVVLQICDLEKIMKKWEAIYQQLRNSNRRT
jgi:glycosyltransferase involved in cell wall biosynthesis